MDRNGELDKGGELNRMGGLYRRSCLSFVPCVCVTETLLPCRA